MNIVGIAANPASNEDWTEQFGLQNTFVENETDLEISHDVTNENEGLKTHGNNIQRVIQLSNDDASNCKGSASFAIPSKSLLLNTENSLSEEINSMSNYEAWEMESDNSKQSDSDDSDVEEDWDMEIFQTSNSKEIVLFNNDNFVNRIETANNGFALRLNILREMVLEDECDNLKTFDTDLETNQDVPACYRFLEKMDNNNLNGNITYYPPTSEAFSLGACDGFPRMNGQQLSKWLSKIVVDKVKLYNNITITKKNIQLKYNVTNSNQDQANYKVSSLLINIYKHFRTEQYEQVVSIILRITNDNYLDKIGYEIGKTTKTKLHISYHQCKALLSYGVRAVYKLSSTSVSEESSVHNVEFIIFKLQTFLKRMQIWFPGRIFDISLLEIQSIGHLLPSINNVGFSVPLSSNGVKRVKYEFDRNRNITSSFVVASCCRSILKAVRCFLKERELPIKQNFPMVASMGESFAIQNKIGARVTELIWDMQENTFATYSHAKSKLYEEFGKEIVSTFLEHFKWCWERGWAFRNIHAMTCEISKDKSSALHKKHVHSCGRQSTNDGVDTAGLRMSLYIRKYADVEKTGLYKICSSLLSLHYLLQSSSPLTFEDDEELEDLIPGLDDYADTDWDYNDHILVLKNGMIDIAQNKNMMVDREVDKHVLDNPQEFEYLSWEIIRRDAACRIEILLPLYVNLPPNVMLKALAGYTAGDFFLNRCYKDDVVIAERLLYECVYCLDKLQGTPEEDAFMMSALGTNALIKYGDALLQNRKYPYAILAYEAAIVSYKLRTGETFDKLTRRLCIICVSNKDFDRALKYHLQILNQAMKEVPEPNVNEIVYVSETISTLQLEQGNFEQAESYLKSAAQFLTAQLKEKSEGKRKTSTQPSQGRSSIYKYGKKNMYLNAYHSNVLKIQLKLAHVLFAKNQVDDAIALLSEILLEKRLPHKQNCEVNLILAKAHLIKNDFSSCERILENLASISTRYKGALSKDSRLSETGLLGQAGDGVRRERLASIKTLPRSNNLMNANGFLYSVKYHMMKAKNFVNAGLFQSALEWVDLSLSICPKNNWHTLGRLYYLRAEIFEKIKCGTIDAVSCKGKSGRAAFDTTMFKRASLYAQCISSSSKSSFYFGKVNDTVQQIKSLSFSISIQLYELLIPALVNNLEFVFVEDIVFQQVEICKLKNSSCDNMEIIDACTSLKSNLHQSLKKSALFCLDLASQTGSSALMLSCLVNMVGANIINGQILCASKYWNEAYKLLVTTYLVDWISLDAIDNGISHIPVIPETFPPSLIYKIKAMIHRLCVALLFMDQAFLSENSSIMLIWIYFNSNAYAECVTLQSDDGIDRTTGNGCIDMTDENHRKTEENEIPTIIRYSKKPTEAVSSRTTKEMDRNEKQMCSMQPFWRHYYCMNVSERKFRSKMLTLSELCGKNITLHTQLFSDIHQNHFRNNMKSAASQYIENISTKINNNKALLLSTDLYYLFQVSDHLAYFNPNSGIIRWVTMSKRLVQTDDERSKKCAWTQKSMQRIAKINTSYNDSNGMRHKKLHELRLSRGDIRADFMPFYNVQHGIGERELNQLLDHPSIRYEAEPKLYSINGLEVLLSSCGMKSLLDLLCIILNEKSIAIVSKNPAKVLVVINMIVDIIKPIQLQGYMIPLLPGSCANTIISAISNTTQLVCGGSPDILPYIYECYNDISILNLDTQTLRLQGNICKSENDFGNINRNVIREKYSFLSKGRNLYTHFQYSLPLSFQSKLYEMWNLQHTATHPVDEEINQNMAYEIFNAVRNFIYKFLYLAPLLCIDADVGTATSEKINTDIFLSPLINDPSTIPFLSSFSQTSMFGNVVLYLYDLSVMRFNKKKRTLKEMDESLQKRVERSLSVYITEMNLLYKTKYERYLDIYCCDGENAVLTRGEGFATLKLKRRWVILDSAGLAYCKSGSKTKTKHFVPIKAASDVTLFLSPEKLFGQTYASNYRSNCITIYSHIVNKTIMLSMNDKRDFEIWVNALRVRMFSTKMKIKILS